MAQTWSVTHVSVPYLNGSPPEQRLQEAAAPLLAAGWEPCSIYADTPSPFTWPSLHIHMWLKRSA